MKKLPFNPILLLLAVVAMSVLASCGGKNPEEKAREEKAFQEAQARKLQYKALDRETNVILIVKIDSAYETGDSLYYHGRLVRVIKRVN